ncbi:hypothetical protein [Afipia massiliensis]|uniref:hypothetical protein n=1 Tax=Afipia massiliensis TaxID=211460 RepID=UPI0014857A8C|nr:hypothetical protein [Afipia massiliensis]
MVSRGLLNWKTAFNPTSASAVSAKATVPANATSQNVSANELGHGSFPGFALSVFLVACFSCGGRLIVLAFCMPWTKI